MPLHAITRFTGLSMLCLALGACTIDTNPDSARVDCGTPGAHGVDCEVKRTGGDGGFEACWDLVISCQNGGEMTGSACHDVAAGANEGTENMPVAAFSGQDSCDVPASGAVQQLKVTSK
ncbi:hypothetical protein ACFONC_10700 [Luteimonas soli]|uniref:Lipoprotein n=1 Tax=Luteimonas soli TaxID=1648966 RepID=A0ABV7XKE3_9GAMM